MRPLTLKIPKALLMVAGRPFIDWQLEKLAACGYDEVIMCVAYLGEQVEQHVGDGSRFGVRVRWSHEGPTLLGTAGALRSALPLLAPSFLVTYGDSYLPFDYASPLASLDCHGDCLGVMSVFCNEGRWDSSNVQTDGEWVLRYEKGTTDPSLNYIDYGATALRREVIAALEQGQFAGLEVIQSDLSKRKAMRAVVAEKRFFEIGSPEGLDTLDLWLSSQKQVMK
jgi:NDP-sugar pyrophosphorylase family protein